MTHGITINISDSKSPRSSSAPANSFADNKTENHPHTANPVRETSRVIVAVYQFFSHNNTAAEAKAQAAVAQLPVLQEQSFCEKYFSCCKR